MSLFSLMADVEDDPFFGSHMRHMREMNSFMMNSMFSDPFGMLGGGGPLSITGPAHGSMNSMMPFMPQMPSLGGMFAGSIPGQMGMGSASSFSSSTVLMSSGPNGKPQVFSSTSSTKIGPNGVKETHKTLQDSRTGTKKMSIGHHIGDRAHVIEREQNVYTGDAEENQELINLEEDDVELFDREFQMKAGASRSARALPPARPALPAPPAPPAPARLALPAPALPSHSAISIERVIPRPSSRRPIRASASLLPTSSASVREVYSAPQPQRKHKHSHKSHRQNDN